MNKPTKIEALYIASRRALNVACRRPPFDKLGNAAFGRHLVLTKAILRAER